MTGRPIPPAERETLPPLVYCLPDCPVCGREVYRDSDVFDPAREVLRCAECGSYWPADDVTARGAWDDKAADGCGATTVNPWTHKTYACVLAIGHGVGIYADPQHHHPEQAGWRGDARDDVPVTAPVRPQDGQAW